MDLGRTLNLIKLLQVILSIYKQTAAAPLDTQTLLQWASCTAMAASKAARLLEQSHKYGAVPAPAVYLDTLTVLVLEATKTTCIALVQALPNVRPTHAVEMKRGREAVELICAAGMRCPEGCGRWRLFILLHFCFTQSIKSKQILALIPSNWAVAIKSLRKQEVLTALEAPGKVAERVKVSLEARAALFAHMWMSSQFVERAARDAHLSTYASASSASATRSGAAALALLSRGGAGRSLGPRPGMGLEEGADVNRIDFEQDADEEEDGHPSAFLGGGVVGGLVVFLPPALLSCLSREMQALGLEAAGCGGEEEQGQSSAKRRRTDV